MDSPIVIALWVSIVVIAFGVLVCVALLNRRLTIVENLLDRYHGDLVALSTRAEARRAHLAATISSDTPAPGGAAAGSVDPTAPRKQG